MVSFSSYFTFEFDANTKIIKGWIYKAIYMHRNKNNLCQEISNAIVVVLL